MQFLRYGVRQAKVFVILGHFLLFQPPDNPENQNFKTEKNTWTYYNFTHLHHKWQSWCVVPEIWSTTTNRIFCHSGPFLPFYPPMNPENQNFAKMNNTTEDIIILQMHTTNDSHMIYGSWDMKCNRQNFLSFWTVVCPFTPLTTWKIKILKNWKKQPGNIIILHKCTKNHDHMLYSSLDMALNGCNYFSFWAIFSPFTQLTARKIKIKKRKKKNAWRYHPFTQV